MDTYENDRNSSNSCENKETFQPDPEFMPVNEAEPMGPAESEALQQDPVVPAPETPNWEDPPDEPIQGAYRGAGSGKKESPFADSPYYMEDQPQAGEPYADEPQAPQTDAYNHYEQPRKTKKPRQKKAGSRRRGSLVAAALVCAILGGVGGGALTAQLTNSKWEKATDELQSSFQAQIAELQNNQGANPQQSGTNAKPVSNENGLTPAQVYAQNMNSVVAISNLGAGNQWGQATQSSGSGFIVSEDGYILSNYHVVQNAQTLTVTLYDGTEYQAKVVGYDAVSDVALLKIDATGLTPVTIGSSDGLEVGEQVVAIGNPLGELTSTLTVGYVSAKGRTINTEGTLMNMLQTDAAINPGNSGGPLFNMKGEVVGITTAKYSGSTNSGASIEGIGFAVPVDDVMSILKDLKEYGYVTGQAFLGVEVRDMDTSVGDIYNLPVGPYVNSVTEGGASDKAGVQAGDIIIALGDYEITNYSDLATALRHFKAGDSTTITVFRSGQKLTLNITLEEKQAPESASGDAESTEPTVSESTPENRESGGFDDWNDFFAPFFGGGN